MPDMTSGDTLQRGSWLAYPEHHSQPSDSSENQAWLRSADWNTSRRLILVGDSLTEGLYESMAETAGATCRFNEKRMFRVPISGLAPPCDHPLVCTQFRAHLRMAWSPYDSICLLAAGRGLYRITEVRSIGSTVRYGAAYATACRKLTRSQISNLYIGDALRCVSALGLFTQRDAVVANAGVWFNGDLQTTYVPALIEFIAWHDEQLPEQRPCTLWRESEPQNFRTPSGLYSDAVANAPSFGYRADQGRLYRASDADHVCCASLNATYLGKQRWNDASTPYLQRANVPIIFLFDLFAAKQHQLDGEGTRSENAGHVKTLEGHCDCTHYSDEFNAIGASRVREEVLARCTVDGGVREAVVEERTPSVRGEAAVKTNVQPKSRTKASKDPSMRCSASGCIHAPERRGAPSTTKPSQKIKISRL